MVNISDVVNFRLHVLTLLYSQSATERMVTVYFSLLWSLVTSLTAFGVFVINVKLNIGRIQWPDSLFKKYNRKTSPMTYIEKIDHE